MKSGHSFLGRWLASSASAFGDWAVKRPERSIFPCFSVRLRVLTTSLLERVKAMLSGEDGGVG